MVGALLVRALNAQIEPAPAPVALPLEGGGPVGEEVASADLFGVGPSLPPGTADIILSTLSPDSAAPTPLNAAGGGPASAPTPLILAGTPFIPPAQPGIIPPVAVPGPLAGGSAVAKVNPVLQATGKVNILADDPVLGNPLLGDPLLGGPFGKYYRPPRPGPPGSDGEDNGFYDGEDYDLAAYLASINYCPPWCLDDPATDPDNQPPVLKKKKKKVAKKAKTVDIGVGVDIDLPPLPGLGGFVFPKKKTSGKWCCLDVFDSLSYDRADDGDFVPILKKKGAKKGKGKGRCPRRCLGLGQAKGTAKSTGLGAGTGITTGLTTLATSTTPPIVSTPTGKTGATGTTGPPALDMGTSSSTMSSSTSSSSTSSSSISSSSTSSSTTPAGPPAGPTGNTGTGPAGNVGTGPAGNTGPSGTPGGTGTDSGTLAGACPGTCNPFNPAANFCDSQTTGCATTGATRYYCACRAGYRYDGVSPTDSATQFKVVGQPYVYGATNKPCNTLCQDQTCTEVPVKQQCA